MTARVPGLAAVLLAFATPVLTQESSSFDSNFVADSANDSSGVPAQSVTDFRSVDEEIQAIKKDLLALNRDLYLLEEELLYPANSQVAFFVSMNVGDYFDLESVSLSIDGINVANYLYTEREVNALVRGGVQRLHVENLVAGEHDLVVELAGDGSQLKDYRRKLSIEFDKGIGAKYVELQITDRVSRQQPEFVIRQWE